MRKQLWQRVLASTALVAALALGGCAGNDGDTGPRGAQGDQGPPGDPGAPGDPGQPGTSLGVLSGTVTNSLLEAPNNGVANVTVAISPAPEGDAVVTSASGAFTKNLPIGVYTLTFAQTGFETQTKTVSIVAAQTATVNVALEPVAPVIVSAAAKLVAAAGETPKHIEFTATVTPLDGSTVTSYEWTEAAPTLIPGDLSNATAATASFPYPSTADLKSSLLTILGTSTVPGGTEEQQSRLLNRTMVLGYSPGDIAIASKVNARVKVTTTSGEYTSPVTTYTVAATDLRPFAVGIVSGNTLRNVPLGEPVLVHGKDAASWNWTLTGPSGSTAALVDETTQNPYFTSDVAGKYTLTNGEETIEIFAAKFQGAIAGTVTPDTSVLPPMADSPCIVCHTGDPIFNREFVNPTSWPGSGHAQIFSFASNFDPEYPAESCIGCHSVGFDKLVNNGNIYFADGFSTFFADPNLWGPGVDRSTNWAKINQTYPAVAKLANIQCENCHGPNGTGSAHTTGEPRFTLASELCGTCHGRPPKHGRYQQWLRSGHSSYETAIGEGTSRNCAGCHSANAFGTWRRQLRSGNPLRSVGATQADFDALGITADNVHPITCQTCHSPHNPGLAALSNFLTEADESLSPEQAEDALVKDTVVITGSTYLLPAGFKADGVGNGALCITCHNSRNGGWTDTSVTPNVNKANLHEDNDPKFGTLTAYAAPHSAAQGDVLMGRNAYFVDGVRAAHADVGDACVTCHMELSLAPAALRSEPIGTNHTFAADPGICSNCHGEDVDAEGLEASVEAELATLAKAITDKITALKGDGVAVILTESHGAPAVQLPDNSVVALKDYIALNQDLAKGIWNLLLIENDSSLGIHNPKFAHDVLFNTTEKVNQIPVAPT